MSPLLKKVAAALAVKEVIDRVQEARRPKRSKLSRAVPYSIPVALAAGVFYLYKSGRLDGVSGKASTSGRQTDPAAYPAGPTTAGPEGTITLPESERQPVT
jgi:hypothetical protein